MILASGDRNNLRTDTTLCHPERTRISYYAAPMTTSCAAFIKESRMSFAEPIGRNRKSGAVERSAVFAPWRPVSPVPYSGTPSGRKR